MQESQFVLELQQAERLRTKLESLKMFLEGRFEPVPADLMERVMATTDLAKVEKMLRAVARIKRLEDLPV